MKFMKWCGLTMAALLALTSIACSDRAKNEDPEPEPVTLEIAGDDVIMLGFGESRALGVRARFKADGLPAAERKISFLITGAANGSTLSEQEVYTNENGVAETNIKAGDTKAQFFVKASSVSLFLNPE